MTMEQLEYQVYYSSVSTTHGGQFVKTTTLIMMWIDSVLYWDIAVCEAYDNKIMKFCTVCVTIYFTDGSLLMSNPGGDLFDPVTYVNLSCPAYDYYSPGSCSIEYGNKDICESQVNLYCYNGMTMFIIHNNDITYSPKQL